MTSYRVVFEDYHEIFVRATSNENAEEIASEMYTDSKVWYSSEM